jgi:hypothetical protein
MRKSIRKRIRRQENGVNLAADVDASIAVNTGAGQRQSVRTTSRRRVVQRSPRANAPSARDSKAKEDR